MWFLGGFLVGLAVGLFFVWITLDQLFTRW